MKFINNFKRGYNAVLKHGKSPMFYLSTLEENNISGASDTVYYTSNIIDEKMAASNMCIAGVLTTNHIVVDNTFKTLTLIAQLFIIRHEQGHMLHKHTGGKRDAYKEVEADIYAMEVMRLDMPAYKRILNEIRPHTSLYGKYELYKRYNIIQKLNKKYNKGDTQDVL